MAIKEKSPSQRILDDMKELARIASIMVDGDVSMRIISSRAAHYIANPHPQYRFLASDYYDVDHGSFLLIKKTLLRLERLVKFDCNATLWVRVEGAPEWLTPVVHNGNLHRYYTFGMSRMEPVPKMTECLDKGRVVAESATKNDKYLTVLAPVRDSLGDIVGCVEFTASNPANAKLRPAWN